MKEKNIFFIFSHRKIIFIVWKNTFYIENYPSEYRELLLTITKNKFYPIHNYIKKLDNILLRFELLSDYEVVAQYQIINLNLLKDINLEKEKIINDSNFLFIHDNEK